MLIDGSSALSLTDYEQYVEEKKDILEKYPNLMPVLDKKTGNYYLEYCPKNVEYFIQDMKALRSLSKQMAILNIQKYGFENEEEKILNALGFKPTKGTKKVSEIVQKQAELFQFIFGDANRDGFVRFRSKATGEYYAYPLEAIQDEHKLESILKSKKHFSTSDDMMYTLNIYNNMHRAEEKYLLSLHLIAIDVDFDYKNSPFSSMTAEEVIQHIEKEFGKTIPVPSAIEYGNRIRLLFKIQCVGANQKSLKVYQLVAQAIAEKIKVYGASAQAPTTYGRILGSVNTRNHSIVDVKILKKEAYMLRDFQRTLLEEPPWLEKWKGKVRKLNRKSDKVIQIENDYSIEKARLINEARLRDFEKIQSYMNANGNYDGRREALCYLYRNYCLLLKMDKEEAREATLRFNSRFLIPERESVIDQDTKNLNRKQYLHHSKTILEFLDLDTEDEAKLNLEKIVSDTEIKRRKNEHERIIYREEVGTLKKEKIQEEMQKIKSLLAEGFKKRDICKKLNVTLRTLERRIQLISQD